MENQSNQKNSTENNIVDPNSSQGPQQINTTTESKLIF